MTISLETLEEYEKFLATNFEEPIYLWIHPKAYTGYWSQKLRGEPRKWIWGLKKYMRKK